MFGFGKGNYTERVVPGKGKIRTYQDGRTESFDIYGNLIAGSKQGGVKKEKNSFMQNIKTLNVGGLARNVRDTGYDTLGLDNFMQAMRAEINRKQSPEFQQQAGWAKYLGINPANLAQGGKGLAEAALSIYSGGAIGAGGRGGLTAARNAGKGPLGQITSTIGGATRGLFRPQNTMKNYGNVNAMTIMPRNKLIGSVVASRAPRGLPALPKSLRLVGGFAMPVVSFPGRGFVNRFMTEPTSTSPYVGPLGPTTSTRPSTSGRTADMWERYLGGGTTKPRTTTTPGPTTDTTPDTTGTGGGGGYNPGGGYDTGGGYNPGGSYGTGGGYWTGGGYTEVPGQYVPGQYVPGMGMPSGVGGGITPYPIFPDVSSPYPATGGTNIQTPDYSALERSGGLAGMDPRFKAQLDRAMIDAELEMQQAANQRARELREGSITDEEDIRRARRLAAGQSVDLAGIIAELGIGGSPATEGVALEQVQDVARRSLSNIGRRGAGRRSAAAEAERSDVSRFRRLINDLQAQGLQSRAEESFRRIAPYLEGGIF